MTLPHAKPRVPGLLDMLRRDWNDRGWDLADLAGYRMEGDEETPEQKAAREQLEALQAEMTRIATREKAEGKRAAEREIAEQLGVSVEEAKQLIADRKAAEDAKKDELAKATEAKAAADAKAADAERQLTEARLTQRIYDALEDAGCADRKARTMLRRTIEAKPDATDEELAAIVEDEVKKAFPASFAAPETAEEKAAREKREADEARRHPKPPAGDPQGSKPDQNRKGDDTLAAATQAAREAFVPATT